MCPNRAEFFEEAGEQTNYGDTIYTGVGCNYAELYRPIHYGGRAVLHFRIHHQLEYGSCAASEVDFRLALCMGHVGGVGLLSRLLCLLVADFEVD